MKKMLGALVVAGVAGTGLGATAGEWVYRTGVGASADAPTLWTDAENWKDGNVPNGAADTATFGAAATGAIFIEAPATLAAKSINSASANKTFYIVGETFVMGDATTEGSFKTHYQYPFRIFGTINYVKGTASGQYGHFAGPILPLNEFVGSAGESYQRLDWGAFGAPGVEEVDLGTFKKITLGSGGLHVCGPGWTDGTTTSGWKVRSGSRYVVKADAKATSTYVPGQFVSGDGLAAGSSVKYIINATTLVLDKPAEDDNDNATLVFAAFHPHVVQHITRVHHNGAASATGVHALAENSKGHETYRMEIDEVTTDQNITLGGAYDATVGSTCSKSGTIVLKKTSGIKHMVQLLNAHLEFQDAGDGLAGIRNAPEVRINGSDYPNARFTVVEGVDARVNAITNLIGTCTKDGPGDLTTTMIPPFDKARLNAYQGRWTFACTSGDFTSDLAKLYVSNAATFAVAPGLKLKVKGGEICPGGTLEIGEGAVVEVASGMLKAGAKVKGPGTLAFTDLTVSELPADVVFSDGVAVRPATVGGALLIERPVGEVVGNPAFWVNTSNVERDMVYTVDAGGVTNVTRWNDCRGAGYNFATNFVSSPKLIGLAGCKGPCLYIDRGSDFAHRQTMDWDKPVTGIRAVFLVFNADCAVYDGEGGGCMLGSTKYPVEFARVGKNLFYNPGGNWTSPNVYNGEIFLNGLPKKPTDQLTSNSFSGNASKKYALLWEAHPLAPGAKADAFGRQADRNDLSGGQRIFECIVYTNELTYAERMKVREYLSAKWFDTGANAEHAHARDKMDELDLTKGPILEVASGAVDVKKATGDAGTFVKKGAGQLLVEDCVLPNATVKAQAGTLYLKSYRMTQDDLPNDETVLLHLDATATNSITWSEIEGKGACVKKIASVRGTAAKTASAMSTNCPLHKIVSDGSGGLKAGMPVLDMGEYFIETRSDKYGEYNMASGETLSFGAISPRTCLAVVGTAKGGGYLLGYNDRWNNCSAVGTMSRDWDADLTDNPSVPLYIGNYHTPRSLMYPTSFSHTKLNSVEIEPSKTGYSGRFDLFSMTLYEDVVNVSAIGCAFYNNRVGGLDLGEIMLYSKWYSPEEVRKFESYLRWKWYGVETEGFRPAQVGTLEVAPGATVDAIGNAPITVRSIRGGGTVAAKVAFAAAAEFVVEVRANGTPSCLTLSAGSDLSAGGTVRLVGEASTLDVGAYDVVLAPGLAAGQAWTLNVESPSRRRVLTLTAKDGRLVLNVSKPGFTLLVR